MAAGEAKIKSAVPKVKVTEPKQEPIVVIKEVEVEKKPVVKKRRTRRRKRVVKRRMRLTKREKQPQISKIMSVKRLMRWRTRR